MVVPPGQQTCEYFYNGKEAQVDDDCYRLLSPHTEAKPAWFFFGDSQMNMMTQHLKYPYEIVFARNTTHMSNPRCGVMDYYLLEKAKQWIPPDKTQGPTKFGLRNHFCLDASGIAPKRYVSSSNFMEYLPVEYASDVEHQSLHTNTSQESATYYLQNELEMLGLTKNDSVCVANTGIHDQKIGRGIQVYLNNVASYLKQLDTICGYIVWLSITSVRGDYNHPQKNSVSIEWNRGVKEMLLSLDRLYPNKFFFLDVWNASSHAIHNSNIHFEPEYYVKLAELFASLM